ncbi:MAG: glycosyltransferase [Bacteroidales bacterium]|nr:glycosyltransferase [Bacteroidales bacterium]
MPILFQINTSVNSCSHGRIAEEIGKLAIEQGWESYIAYGRVKRPSVSHTIKVGTNWDIRWHGLETRLFDRHGLASKKATKDLIVQIEKIQPNIIHLHNIHGYYLNIEILFDYLAKANIPIVWTLHDCWGLTGHCSNFDFIGCEKWKTQCYSCPQIREYPASYFIDRSTKNYFLKKKFFTSVKNLSIIPVSNWLKNIVKFSFLAEYPIQVINNGIDTHLFTPMNGNAMRQKLGLINSFVLLGVANVWGSRKGLDDFLQLSRELSNNCKIVLVGLSNKQLNKLPSNIIGIARTENVGQLAELYSIADLFINPTWEDNFPTSNLEALACGTPVLTYNTGGSIEAITPEIGFVVEQGDINGILNAVNIVKEKGKTYYSNACRERAVKFYNNEDRYQEYIDLYNKIKN